MTRLHRSSLSVRRWAPMRGILRLKVALLRASLKRERSRLAHSKPSVARCRHLKARETVKGGLGTQRQVKSWRRVCGSGAAGAVTTPTLYNGDVSNVLLDLTSWTRVQRQPAHLARGRS